jgi:carbonic anhydrase/acetyltransferase-like protein (isoleucine patch superfamily)
MNLPRNAPSHRSISSASSWGEGTKKAPAYYRYHTDSESMKEILHFRPELVDPTAYIAPGAVVLGDVTLGAESSVWFNAVLRGDTDTIRIGKQTNVQDLCVIHCDEGVPCTLGDRVTMGHGAVIHGATIGDDCLIGMKAVVLNRATIGAGSLIAVGAVVTEGTVILPGSLVIGIPGRVVRPLTEIDQGRIRHGALHYVEAAKRYRAELSSGSTNPLPPQQK